MSTENRVTQPMSRRDVWLTIALAVARDGLPAPEHLEVVDDRTDLLMATRGQVRAWIEYAGLSEDRAISYGSSQEIIGGHGTWPADRYIRVHALVEAVDEQPEPSPLAEQVVAAIGGAS